MKIFILSCVVFVLSSISTNIVFAGSLEKYGDSSRYKSAPVIKSPRQEAIDKAVRILNSRTETERNRLIELYQERLDKAVEGNRYDEIRFYSEILERSGTNEAQ